MLETQGCYAPIVKEKARILGLYSGWVYGLELKPELGLFQNQMV